MRTAPITTTLCYSSQHQRCDGMIRYTFAGGAARWTEVCACACHKTSPLAGDPPARIPAGGERHPGGGA